MAKKKITKKGKVPKWARFLVWILGFIILGLIVYFVGNSLIWRKVTLTSCGSDLQNYKYSLEIPYFWTTNRTRYDKNNVDYELNGLNTSFTVSCTTLGVGGGCEQQFLTKFNVDGKNFDACFGMIDGQWKLSDFNLDRNPVTKSIISFSSAGLDKSYIEKLLSTFKIIGN